MHYVSLRLPVLRIRTQRTPAMKAAFSLMRKQTNRCTMMSPSRRHWGLFDLFVTSRSSAGSGRYLRHCCKPSSYPDGLVPVHCSYVEFSIRRQAYRSHLSLVISEVNPCYTAFSRQLFTASLFCTSHRHFCSFPGTLGCLTKDLRTYLTSLLGKAEDIPTSTLLHFQPCVTLRILKPL